MKFSAVMREDTFVVLKRNAVDMISWIREDVCSSVFGGMT